MAIQSFVLLPASASFLSLHGGHIGAGGAFGAWVSLFKKALPHLENRNLSG
jgi:hypothetical protein